MIVVLSLYRPRLEDVLVMRGERILALIPDGGSAYRDRDAGYPVRTIDHWDNYTELSRLAAEFEALGVTAVATIDEPCVRAAALLRELLGLPGQSFASAVACTDKAVMKTRLAAAGVPVAEHRVVRGVDDIRGFLDDVDGDIVVKPRCGFGTLNTHLVSRANIDRLVSENAFAGPRDLPDYFASTNVSAGIGYVSAVAERRIDIAAEYHCELLMHEGVEIHCLPGRYASPMLGGSSMGSVLLDPDSEESVAVRELTRAAAAALGVTHGFGHCEVFRDVDGRWLVGEFGSRPGGLLIPRMLELSRGIDNLAMLADQLAGQRPGPSARCTPRAVAWRAVRVVGSGVITSVPTAGELVRLPDVLEAQVMVRPGASTADMHGTMFHAAYLLVGGSDPAAAEQAAARAEAMCRIVVESAA